MRTKNELKAVFSVSRGRCAGIVLLAGSVLSICLFAGGCREGELKAPEARVEVVKAYGQTLDEDATPKQVAFVLLQLLKKDVEAAQAHQHEKQEDALKQTFRLAAYSTIENRREATVRPGTELSEEQQNEKLFDIVNYWAPIVAHYIRSFDTEFEVAQQRMKVTYSQNRQFAHVLYPVRHDPAESDPEEIQAATLDIELARQPADGKSFWRVSRVSFRDEMKIAPPAQTQPTTTRAAD
jgi:hypothetical protein